MSLTIQINRLKENDILKTRVTTMTNNAVVLAVIFTAVVGFSQALYAADDANARITATSDVKPLFTLTGGESQAVALAAGRLLHHVDAARQAIAEEKKDDATRHIDQGLKLVQIIENAVEGRKNSIRTVVFAIM